MRIQRRTLFDVQFNESSDLGNVDQRLTARHVLQIHAAASHSFAQRARTVTVLQVDILFRQLTEHTQRTDIGLTEEGAFFTTHHQNRVVTLRRVIRFAHVPSNSQSGDDTGQTVVVTALRHAVGVRAGNKCGQRTVLTRQRHPNITGTVRHDFQIQAFTNRAQIIVDFRFFGGITLTGHAKDIAAHFANIIKNLLGKTGALHLQIRHSCLLLTVNGVTNLELANSIEVSRIHHINKAVTNQQDSLSSRKITPLSCSLSKLHPALTKSHLCMVSHPISTASVGVFPVSK